MKKGVLAIIMALFIMPVSVMASESGLGIYVAPKLMYGVTTFKMSGEVESTGLSGSVSSSESKNTFGGAFALGYDFDRKFAVPIRTELEYSIFSQAKSKKQVDEAYYSGKINLQSLFINTYYDFHNASKFTPYLGAGIGLGIVKADGGVGVSSFDLSIGDKTSTNFAWNIGLGVAYDFTNNLALDLGYRYAQFGSAKTDSLAVEGVSVRGKLSNIAMHQLSLGLRITF